MHRVRTGVRVWGEVRVRVRFSRVWARLGVTVRVWFRFRLWGSGAGFGYMYIQTHMYKQHCPTPY